MTFIYRTVPIGEGIICGGIWTQVSHRNRLTEIGAASQDERLQGQEIQWLLDNARGWWWFPEGLNAVIFTQRFPPEHPGSSSFSGIPSSSPSSAPWKLHSPQDLSLSVHTTNIELRGCLTSNASKFGADPRPALPHNISRAPDPLSQHSGNGTFVAGLQHPPPDFSSWVPRTLPQPPHAEPSFLPGTSQPRVPPCAPASPAPPSLSLNPH